MNRRTTASVVLLIGLMVAGRGQPGLASVGRPPRTESTNARPTLSKIPRRPTTRRSAVSAKRRKLFQEASELTSKIQRSGPWSNHAQVIERGIENMWQGANWNTDTDQFAKRMMIDVSKRPPWDFHGRLNTASELVKNRYGLNDEQVKKLKINFMQRSFAFFVQNAEQVLPVAREVIETRLANKPFTPEKVAKWAKAMRPVMDRWYPDSGRALRKFAAQNLTPAQQGKFRKDLAVFDRRANETRREMMRWEKGEWMPEMWGLQDDPLHIGLQAQLAEAKRQRQLAPKPPDRPKTLTPATPKPPPIPRRRGGAPMRVGEAVRGTAPPPPQESSTLPDETKWVAYVRDFCIRYGLDEAQKASAYAILKDLQERAQAYRSSRIEDIKRFEARTRQAKTATKRRGAQAELREVLRGIDELFEELKTRLKNIPTAAQLRQAG